MPHKLSTHVISAAFALVILSVGPALCAESSFHLRQESGVIGDIDIYVCKSALKLVQNKLGRGFVMRAPLWRVQFFNVPAKAVYETDVDRFKGGTAAGLLSSARFVGLVPAKTNNKHAVVANRKATVSEWRKRMRISFSPKADEWDLVRSATYYAAEDLPVSPQGALAVQRYCRLPAVGGFPLKVDIINENGNRKNEFRTVSCESVNLPEGFFSVGKDYKRVHSEEAVAVHGHGELLKDVIETLDSKN